MTTLEARSTPATTPQLVELVEHCNQVLEVALENIAACRRLLAGVSPEPAGPHLVAACRIQRGQQVIHDQHWWHVLAAERGSIDSVLLTLTRPGISGRPLVLDVDPDDTFTVCDISR